LSISPTLPTKTKNKTKKIVHRNYTNPALLVIGAQQ